MTGLTLRGVKKSFGELTVIRGIDLDIPEPFKTSTILAARENLAPAFTGGSGNA